MGDVGAAIGTLKKAGYSRSEIENIRRNPRQYGYKTASSAFIGLATQASPRGFGERGLNVSRSPTGKIQRTFQPAGIGGDPKGKYVAIQEIESKIAIQKKQGVPNKFNIKPNANERRAAQLRRVKPVFQDKEGVYVPIEDVRRRNAVTSIKRDVTPSAGQVIGAIRREQRIRTVVGLGSLRFSDIDTSEGFKGKQTISIVDQPRPGFQSRVKRDKRRAPDPVKQYGSEYSKVDSNARELFDYFKSGTPGKTAAALYDVGKEKRQEYRQFGFGVIPGTIKFAASAQQTIDAQLRGQSRAQRQATAFDPFKNIKGPLQSEGFQRAKRKLAIPEEGLAFDEDVKAAATVGAFGIASFIPGSQAVIGGLVGFSALNKAEKFVKEPSPRAFAETTFASAEAVFFAKGAKADLKSAPSKFKSLLPKPKVIKQNYPRPGPIPKAKAQTGYRSISLLEDVSKLNPKRYQVATMMQFSGSGTPIMQAMIRPTPPVNPGITPKTIVKPIVTITPRVKPRRLAIPYAGRTGTIIGTSFVAPKAFPREFRYAGITPEGGFRGIFRQEKGSSTTLLYEFRKRPKAEVFERDPITGELKPKSKKGTKKGEDVLKQTRVSSGNGLVQIQLQRQKTAVKQKTIVELQLKRVKVRQKARQKTKQKTKQKTVLRQLSRQRSALRVGSRQAAKSKTKTPSLAFAVLASPRAAPKSKSLLGATQRSKTAVASSLFSGVAVSSRVASATQSALSFRSRQQTIVGTRTRTRTRTASKSRSRSRSITGTKLIDPIFPITPDQDFPKTKDKKGKRKAGLRSGCQQTSRDTKRRRLTFWVK